MILEFPNLKEEENDTSNSNFKYEKLDFLEIQSSFMDLSFLNENKSCNKPKSEPSSSKAKKNLKKIFKNVINEIKDTNLNFKEEEDKINQGTNDIKLRNKNKINNNINFNKLNNNDSQNDFLKKNIEKNPNKNELNLNKGNSKNFVNLESDSKNVNLKENKDNIVSNYFGINNELEDNSSIKSGKNQNLNNNNRASIYSSSSFSKNFILKSEICKSTRNNENNRYKINNYNNNPIMNYFNFKNFGNFYLFTDNKSQDNIDGNQFLNFFPLEQKESKTKEKDIMRCIYADRKLNKTQEDVTSELYGQSNENEEQKEKAGLFNLNAIVKIDGEYEDIKDGKNEFENEKLKSIDKNTDKIILNNLSNNLDNINNGVKDQNINDITIKNKKDDFLQNTNEKFNNISLKDNTNLSEINNNFKYNKNEQNIENNNSLTDNKISFISNNINGSSLNINKDFSSQKEIINNNTDSIGNNNNNNNLFINGNENAKLPLSFSNTTFNINDSNVKEFKLSNEILLELSNLNKKFNINSFSPLPSVNYNQPADNIFNSMNNKNDNINISNEVNFNNFNPNENYNINFDFNNYNFYENINNNSINLLPSNKSFYDYTDDELLQYSIILIKDQSGCRFLQEKIKINQNFANEKLFQGIKYYLKELSIDPFGNYFLQALLDILTYENIDEFLNFIKQDFLYICISPHGTRVIQKLIEKIFSIQNLMSKFVNMITSEDLGTIFKSPYGNHIMQKMLTTAHSSEYTEFIYNYTLNNFMEIAETKHGVCVIQKCVTEGDLKQREKIYEIILNNFDVLVKDEFGNYLIQYILINNKKNPNEIMPIILKLEANLLNYCKSKYSANVIEKCFENNDIFIKEHILEYFLNNYKENIIEILLDPYGIYIIQKALNLNDAYKKRLLEIIAQKENELRKINLNDFKYRGVLKIINSNKELKTLLYKSKDDGNHNKNYKYFNNKEKYKRGKKNYKGNSQY